MCQSLATQAALVSGIRLLLVLVFSGVLLEVGMFPALSFK